MHASHRLSNRWSHSRTYQRTYQQSHWWPDNESNGGTYFGADCDSNARTYQNSDSRPYNESNSRAHIRAHPKSYNVTVQTGLQITTTFREKITFRVSARYVVYQLGYTVVFASLLWLTISSGVHPAYAPLFVIAVVTPVNFAVSRWVIKGRAAF